MLEAHPDFDPHGLKGAKLSSSTHVNEPYQFTEFPKALYKEVNGEQLTCTVYDKEGEDKAIADGFGVDPAGVVVVAETVIEPVHVVIDDAHTSASGPETV